MLKLGTKGSASDIVNERNSARTLGSGTVDLLATPAMIALMEKAAWTSVADQLPSGSGSVGIKIDVKHLSASPLHMKVTATSELIEVDRKKLTFKVTASDETGMIGEGIHERFIVEEVEFQERANKKEIKNP